MDPGLMSSEDSGIDEDDEVITVKSIPWRSGQWLSAAGQKDTDR